MCSRFFAVLVSGTRSQPMAGPLRRVDDGCAVRVVVSRFRHVAECRRPGARQQFGIGGIAARVQWVAMPAC